MMQTESKRQQLLQRDHQAMKNTGNRVRPVLGGYGLALVALAMVPGATVARDLGPAEAFLQKHCYHCHSDKRARARLDFKALARDLTQPGLLAKWVRVFDRVKNHEMPPKYRDQPTAEEHTAFLKSLGDQLTTASAARARTVIRRLNRFEYENTLRDLLGVRSEVREMLPEDGKAHGFDNVGEALDISAVQLQAYMKAASKVLEDATCRGPKPKLLSRSYTFDKGKNARNIGKHWHKTPDGAVVFFNSGRFPSITLNEFKAPHKGTYRVSITGYAYQSKKPVAFAVYAGKFGRSADSIFLGYFDLPPGKPTEVTIQAHLRERDSLRLMPHLHSRNYAELRRNGPAAYKGVGLAVQKVDVQGPVIASWPGRGHRHLFGDLVATKINDKGSRNKRRKKFYRPRYEIVSKQPAIDAERLLQQFIPVAFRRPVTAQKIAPYLRLAKAELASGAKFEEAMRTAYIAVLCSPDFLYLRESPGKLDDFALASRLSYFLWSSLPDKELLQLASRGQLSQPAVLRGQTERLLADPRAKRFTRNFVSQWLNLREIEFTIPDKLLYPEFDRLLLDGMVKETELFFEEVLRNNLSLHQFIDSDWTMLNERLARHYRIEGVTGLEFRKVKLKPEHHRGGVLTHASVLKVSANGTTTSPVIRGAWILERIVGKPTPPPPPGVPGVEPDIRGATTLREQLQKHRDSTSCAGCHKHIDPPGFALENYDVMGGWRENYRVLNNKLPRPSPELTGGQRVRWRVGPKVDASGVTANGEKFRNLEDYKLLLLKDRTVVARALTEKVLTYASGRGLGFSDRPEVERVTRVLASKNYGFRELIHQVVQSSIFQRK